MTLSAAIMAHPRRADMVTELRRTLDRDVPVVWDEVNDRHDTGIRAIEAHVPTCTHHLVVQDDVLPCRDLIAGAERALAHVPADSPVSLYVGNVRPFGEAVRSAVNAAAGGASWITMSGLYWGPAVILPTHLIPELAAAYRAAKTENYDRRMSHWFEKRNVRCWYSWPSLVEHRDSESLAHPKTGPGRHAHRFVGSDVSALTLDWSGPVVDMENTARLDAQRQAAAVKAARRKARDDRKNRAEPVGGA